jgi:hypothetical protein
VILLSLALVVATATTLAWGVFASSDPLIWASLAAGLGAVASVAGSVVRRRRHLVPEAIPDAGRQQAGSTTVGAASAGLDPAPSPAPSRPAESVPAPPAADPVSPTGTRPEYAPGAKPDTRPGTAPGSQSWPWSTPPPGAPETGARPGWTGPVPVPPRSADEAPADQASAPAAAPQPQAPPVAEAPEPQVLPIPEPPGEPAVEQVPVRDALRVAQLVDEVLVVDGHPRYHLASCPTLAGAAAGAGAEAGAEAGAKAGAEAGAGTVPLAVSAARRGGFTPCAVCAPDRTLLARSRERAQQKAQQRAQDRAIERPTDDSQQL